MKIVLFFFMSDTTLHYSESFDYPQTSIPCV